MDMVVNRVMEMTTLPLDELIVLQGDLKSLSAVAYHKFRKQLLENGFTSPFHIWVDPKTKKKNLLDGTQRLKVLKMMRDDGVQLPATLPAVVIEAQDKPHALRILLALATQYGKMTDESLSEFAIDAGISLEWIENHIELPDNMMVHISADSEFDPSKSSEAEKAHKVCPHCGENL